VAVQQAGKAEQVEGVCHHAVLGLSPSHRELAHQQFVCQHRHGAVRHGAEQVDREALVEPTPALKVDDLARGADDAGALAAAYAAAAAARRGQQEPPLRLQARAHDFVRVRRHRGRHLCHRGAKEDRVRRDWPVVAMPLRDYLEPLVERKLHGDVGDAEEAGQQPAVKGAYALAAVDGDGGIERVTISRLIT